MLSKIKKYKNKIKKLNYSLPGNKYTLTYGSEKPLESFGIKFLALIISTVSNCSSSLCDIFTLKNFTNFKK